MSSLIEQLYWLVHEGLHASSVWVVPSTKPKYPWSLHFVVTFLFSFPLWLFVCWSGVVVFYCCLEKRAHFYIFCFLGELCILTKPRTRCIWYHSSRHRLCSYILQWCYLFSVFFVLSLLKLIVFSMWYMKNFFLSYLPPSWPYNSTNFSFSCRKRKFLQNPHFPGTYPNMFW